MLDQHYRVSNGGIVYQFVSLKHQCEMPLIAIEYSNETLVFAKGIVGNGDLSLAEDVGDRPSHNKDTTVAIAPKLVYCVCIVHDEIPYNIPAKHSVNTGSINANGISRIIDLVLTVKDAVFDEVQPFSEIRLIFIKS